MKQTILDKHSKLLLVMFWSIVIVVFAWFNKLQNPDKAWEFIKWLVGLYIAGNVGDKWATRK